MYLVCCFVIAAAVVSAVISEVWPTRTGVLCLGCFDAIISITGHSSYCRANARFASVNAIE